MSLPPSFPQLLELILSFIDDLLSKEPSLSSLFKQKWLIFSSFSRKKPFNPASLQNFIKSLTNDPSLIKNVCSLDNTPLNPSNYKEKPHINLPYSNNFSPFKKKHLLDQSIQEKRVIKTDQGFYSNRLIETPKKLTLSYLQKELNSEDKGKCFKDSPSLISFGKKEFYLSKEQEISSPLLKYKESPLKIKKFRFDEKLKDKVMETKKILEKNSEKLTNTMFLCFEIISPKGKGEEIEGFKEIKIYNITKKLKTNRQEC